MDAVLTGRLAPAALVALVALTLSGCGSAPADAAEGDFCGAAVGLFSGPGTEAATPQEEAEQVRIVGETMAEVGTPADIGADARRGFELAVQMLEDMDAADVAAVDDGRELDDDFSAQEKDQLDAFGKYAFETCEFDIPGLTPPEPPEVSESPAGSDPD